MKIKNIFKFAAPLSIAALLSACGGGGSSGGAIGIGSNTAPSAPTVSLNYGIKELQFSWEAVPNASYYRLSENPDGTSGYSVVEDNLTATSVNHEIALHRRINARYMVDACNDIGCTASSEILMANNLVDAIGYFKASNTDAGDEFGVSISLSADGTTLAVGADVEASATTGVDGDQTDNSANYSGAVYVFTRNADGWVQQAYLKASNAEGGDYFGSALGLSADGNTLAVGASGEDSSAIGVDGPQWANDQTDSGAVYVFVRSGTTWSQQNYLKPPAPGAGDAFGHALSLSGDGNTLAVGAYLEDSDATGVDGDWLNEAASDSGAVYVFSRSGTTWAQQAYLKASNTEMLDQFGYALSLSANGNTLVVGAFGEDSGATGVDADQLDNSVSGSGAVYLFSRSGTTWSQQTYLKPSNTGASYYFGVALSLSADGNTLAVGAINENGGAVYLFSPSGSTWAEQAYLKASNPDVDDRFGHSVSLSTDGSTLAVGAIEEASTATGINGDETNNSATYSGAAYLFTFDGTTWTQQAYLKAANTDAGDNDGNAISLSGDGNTLAVGAYQEDSAATGIGGDGADNSASYSGAVYIY